MLNYYKRSAAKLGLADKVIFTGQLTQQEIVPYIIAADLCLVYYKNEPVNLHRASMKLREYLALGAEVAANSVGEIKDFKGYVHLSGVSVSAYSHMINICLKKMNKSGLKGKAYIYGNYDWNKGIKGFVLRIKEIIKADN